MAVGSMSLQLQQHERIKIAAEPKGRLYYYFWYRIAPRASESEKIPDLRPARRECTPATLAEFNAQVSLFSFPRGVLDCQIILLSVTSRCQGLETPRDAARMYGGLVASRKQEQHATLSFLLVAISS
jgi:hypothetical protein